MSNSNSSLARLLETQPNRTIPPKPSGIPYSTDVESAPYRTTTATATGVTRPVDINVMKRNMSIAKGFMDISLLTANANQLRHLVMFGSSESPVYYILFVGLVLSLILQVTVGVLLIVKERFDLNLEEDHESAELYNNITVLLVFLTLLLNVFISSFGVDVAQPGGRPNQQPVYARNFENADVTSTPTSRLNFPT